MARTKVQAEVIATNAISGTIIADGAITSTHLAANCVDSSELVTGSIDTIHIAANQVTATKIVTNGVLTRHISDDQVTAAKLANSINTDIATGVTANTTANAALPKAGGTMTGGLSIRGFNGPILKLGSSGTADPRIDFEDQNSTNLAAGIFFDQDTDTLRILRTVSGSATDGIAIDSSGNIGIGAATPNYQLHIKKTGSAEIELEGTVSAELNLHDSGGTANQRRGRLTQNGSGFKLQALNDADDTVTHEFIAMDCATGNVGIGTTSPNSYSNVTTLTINGTNQGRVDLEYGGTLHGSFLALSGETQIKASGGSQVMVFEVNDAERMRIDTSGRVTKPTQPYFEAYRSGSQTGYNASGNYAAVVVYNSATHNVGGHYNTSTGYFTAPVAGIYCFTAAAYCNFSAGQSWFSSTSGRINGTDTVYSAGKSFPECHTILKLGVGDTVGYHPYKDSMTNGTINANGNHTYFKGYLMG